MSIISEKYPSVKNIILDLGNVILDVDQQATINEFLKRGKIDFNNFPTQILNDFEIGKYSESEFITLIKKHVPDFVKYSNTELIECWNAMLGNWSVSRLNVLIQLKTKYRLFLLSNTNALHVKHFTSTINSISEIPFHDYFEKVYFSNEVGIRKPNIGVYKKVLSDNNLTANESLYVDDLLVNLEPAKELGMHTFHIEKGKFTLEDIF